MRTQFLFLGKTVAILFMTFLCLEASTQCTTLCDENDEITYDYYWKAATVYSSDIFSELGDVWEDLNIRITGDLVINSTQAIWIKNCKVRMEAGGKIIVNDDRFLFIVDSEIWACDNMWKGIEVNEDAYLNLDGNRIEDAQFAVHADHAGSLTILDNDFNGNNVGIYIIDRYVPRSGSSISSVFSIAGNQFRCCSGLIGAYTGQSPPPGEISYAGVILVDADYVAIGSDRFDENEFDELMNGIIAENSIFDVVNSSFTDITWVQGDEPSTAPYPIRNGAGLSVFYGRMYQEGFGSGANDDYSFHNCDVYAIGTFYSVADINNNHIRDFGKFGISVRGALDAGSSILNNRFTEDTNPNYSSQRPIIFGKSKYGFDLVENNHLDIPVYCDLGIQIGGWPYTPSEMVVRENTISNVDRGILVNIVSSNNIFIDDNTISVDEDGTTEGEYGISLESSFTGQNNHVRWNTVTGDGDTESGILGTRAVGVEYCENYVDEFIGGFVFRLACDDSDFKYNHIDDNDYGLFIWSVGVIGPQRQKGNEWIGSYSEWGAIHNSGNSAYARTFSPFDVNTNVGQGGDLNHLPPTISPDDWFREIVGEAVSSCDTTIVSIDSATSHMNNISDFDYFVVKDSFLIVSKDTVENWNDQYYIYKKLKLNSNLKTMSHF